MKVVFRTNLGSMDAKKLGLNEKACRVGATADVDRDVAETLVKAGIAANQDDAKSDALIRSAQGIADPVIDDQEAVIAVAKPVEVKGVK